jgi:hypothetical protein
MVEKACFSLLVAGLLLLPGCGEPRLVDPELLPTPTNAGPVLAALEWRAYGPQRGCTLAVVFVDNAHAWIAVPKAWCKGLE